MTTLIVALNVVFAVGVLVVIVGGHLYAIATQHRDHGVLSSGPVFRRRIWARRSRPHTGPVRPTVVPRRGQVRPAA